MLVVIAAGAMLAAARVAAEDAANRSAADEPVHAPAADTSKSLDLRAPPLTELYTREQIEAMVARTAPVDDKSVVVEGTREPPPHVTPDIWQGIATPFWALLHPTQAWRVFLPLPPDQVRGTEKKPEPVAELPAQLPFR
jgi:hypothetical protein